MINVFITVGTTPFDELIKFCDNNIDTTKFKVLAQTSNHSRYIANNITTIEFTDNIDKLYKSADIIISHAGAGSVYKILERNKKAIFVPNFTMKDNHQDDICRFVKDNHYALTLDIRETMDLNTILFSITKKTFTRYLTANSTLIAEIYRAIDS